MNLELSVQQQLATLLTAIAFQYPPSYITLVIDNNRYFVPMFTRYKYTRT
jgi:hypothetical protein